MSKEAMEDGWCDWEYHSPLESSLLCCDCELIHEVDVRVVRYESLDSEVYEVVNDPNLEAQIRLRRRDDISPRRNTGWVYADDISQDHVDETAKQEHEPVAWMHNFIEGNVITHIPADIGRHPERWTALYKDPTPCKTCESLAMTVMNDQTYHEKVIPKREWVGLTDEEVSYCRYAATFCDELDTAYMAELIEKDLKEKNT